MRAVSPIAVAALAALGLAACSQSARTGGVNGICKPFTTASAQANPPAATTLPGANVLPAAPAGDPSSPLDDCLHRWGYALAAGSDTANVVAQATLAACTSQLAEWNQQSLTTGGGGAGAPNSGTVEAPSLMTGQTTNPLAEHFSFAQGRALFYVVQARAGKCPPPPATAGNTATNRTS